MKQRLQSAVKEYQTLEDQYRQALAAWGSYDIDLDRVFHSIMLQCKSHIYSIREAEGLTTQQCYEAIHGQKLGF